MTQCRGFTRNQVRCKNETGSWWRLYCSQHKRQVFTLFNFIIFVVIIGIIGLISSIITIHGWWKEKKQELPPEESSTVSQPESLKPHSLPDQVVKVTMPTKYGDMTIEMPPETFQDFFKKFDKNELIIDEPTEGNHKDICTWIRKAAKHGDAEAQAELSKRCIVGQGIYQGGYFIKVARFNAEERMEFIYWLKKAAELGDAEAQNTLGVLYAQGRTVGIFQDDKEAVKWFEKAANQNFADAQFNLGLMLAKGWGGTVNQKKAIQWFILAANQGHSKAQAILNKLFAKKQAIANNQTAESQNQNSEVQNAVENNSAESPVEQPDFMTISEIIAKEQRALQQIEKELNITLEKLDKIEWRRKGYVLNEKGQVTGLSCYDCEIKDLNRIIEPLKDLRNLSWLNLSYNKISELSGLKDLSNLRELSLWDNQISELSALKDLSNLRELDLSYNQIRELSGLKDLRNLSTLDLSGNKIRELSGLKDLSLLSKLYLSGNKISELSGLKDLSNLSILVLNFNQISELSALKNLRNLRELSLGYNRIRELSGLKDLRKLEKLYLKNNPLEELPVWITDFNMDIQWHWIGGEGIVLYNNPLKNPPVEIVKQGKEAIRQYFEAQNSEF